MLDNFEHVQSAAPLLDELLLAAPSLKILVTSRTCLHLYGEHEFFVPPLGLPPLSPLPSTQVLAEYPAVALFIQRSQAAQAGFELTHENAPAVAQLAHRLDGLPLALELAAARGISMTPQQILEQLDNRLDFLTGGSQELPQRQQTLRATIDWSYGRLSDQERTLLRRLAVFAGTWSLEAAEEVCSGHGHEAVGVVELLPMLIDKSLVQLQDHQGQPRYGMLETIREYLVEQLKLAGELEQMQALHARCYLAWAEQREPESRDSRQGEWLRALEREHANLRAALSWAHEHGAIELALRISAAIWVFWQIHGHVSEGRQWMEAAFSHERTVFSAARAKALWGAGWLLSIRLEHDGAKLLFEQGVLLARKLGETRSVGLSLHGLGSVARSQGDYASATQAFEESLPLFQQVDDQDHVAWTYQHLGVLALDQGDCQRGIMLLEQAIKFALGQCGSLVEHAIE